MWSVPQAAPPVDPGRDGFTPSMCLCVKRGGDSPSLSALDVGVCPRGGTYSRHIPSVTHPARQIDAAAQ